jgi:hypothetical protein
MTQQERGDNGHPEFSFCEEKRRLLEEFGAAHDELMGLQTQQMQAVTDHDPDFSRFDDLIHMAKRKKDEAKYAIVAHISQHHCW